MTPRDARVHEALGSAKLRGSWWKTNCPFCIDRVGKEDRERCFSVHASSGGFHCFRCRVRGRVQLSDSFFVEKVAGQTQSSVTVIEPPPTFTLLAEGSGATAVSTAQARAYLESRRLPVEVWEAARIGACTGGPYASRVVIPVLDERDRWVGYSARLWTAKCDKKLKYRNATGEWKGQVIYNPTALTLETDEPCYVVEGCFDALAHWPNAVAVLGDATDLQVGLLAKAQRPIVVVLDGDAWVKGWSLAMKLRLEGVRAGAVQLPSGKDPDEVDPAWLWEEARASLG